MTDTLTPYLTDVGKEAEDGYLPVFEFRKNNRESPVAERQKCVLLDGCLKLFIPVCNHQARDITIDCMTIA
jgi:hypothetical protein